MKKTKIIIAAVIAVIVVAAVFTSVILTAGGNADVIKTYSEKSLSKVYEVCESKGYVGGNSENYTISVDGGAQFFRGDGKVGIRVDVSPFIAAGLNVEALPESYSVADGILTLSADETRDIVGYHSAMGHFNYSMGGGSFEWAQDMYDNHMDIVFALSPDAFTAAGVDPDKVEGWSYSSVEMHSEGKTVEEMMFLKSYDLV